jgi:Rieske Fe-S protein
VLQRLRRNRRPASVSARARRHSCGSRSGPGDQTGARGCIVGRLRNGPDRVSRCSELRNKDREVILVRYQQAVYAFSLSCPHQKTPLRWQEDEHHFKCPKHKSRFEPDGTFIDGKATRNMDRYAIQRQGNDVVVDLGKLYREDENREGWIAAVVRL